jgi:hypothetical protein
MDIPVAGLPGIIPAVTKNIRMIRFIEDFSNSVIDRGLTAIAGKEMSLLGRKGVKSYLGAGTVGTRNADAMGTWAVKRLMGMPLYELDVDRAMTSKFWQVSDYERKMGTALSRANKRYAGDDKAFNAFDKRHNKAMDRYYQHMKAERLSDKYPRLPEMDFLRLPTHETLQERLRKKKVR